MPSLSFFIPMQPPTVTSQQKRAVRIGDGVRFFKSKKQKAADNLYHALLFPYRPEKPFTGPLTLILAFTLPWRKSERKAVLRSFAAYPCATRPDCDNRSKQICDVMTALRFWEDDGQISSLCIHKAYGDLSGVSITLSDSLATQRGGGVVQLAPERVRSCARR